MQQKFESEARNVFAEKADMITLSFNDDKRLQSFNKVKSDLYGKVLEKYAKNIHLQYVKAKS